jgi:hypothetical protein
MSNKKRRIVGLYEDKGFFNIDVRISIPKSQISGEYVDDALNMAEEIVNGRGNQVYYAIIEEGADGRDKLIIGNDYFYGVGNTPDPEVEPSEELVVE